MNTNDPQAEYGKPKEREPMLADYNDILDYDDTDSDGWHTYYEGSAMVKLQAFYENLIATGKLRVVGEVELTPNSYDCLLTCSGCKEGVPYYLAEEFADCKYCPYCGNKIKQ